LNGAEHLLQAALKSGAEVCFANPGTTELTIVGALESVPIRPVLALAEGVCAGAADGYARMTGKPALTLLHLGPGLANAVSNLHNARRGMTPVVNLVGDHPAWHRNADPPLASDIEGLAQTVSTWVRTVRRPADTGPDVADAIRAATSLLGVATLVVPADCQWGTVDDTDLPPMAPAYRSFASDAVTASALALRSGGRSVLVLGGDALGEPGLLLAARIAAATGCGLLCTRLPARIERGAHLPTPIRLGYYPEQLISQFEGLQTAILAGSRLPLPVFAEPEQAGRVLSAELQLETLARPEDDVVGALSALADLVAGGATPDRTTTKRPELPAGRLTVENLGLAVAALQPEGAIVVDESITLVRARQSYFAAAAGSPPHTLLTLTGGSLGMGIPCAVGAATACPDRPVISIQADGSALYAIQGLWTQARESLNVTTLICANHRYEILRNEVARTGNPELGPVAAALTALDRPTIDFVSVARGFGVPASRCDTVEDLAKQLGSSFAEAGPYLIEVAL
jgi:acetolactate synthase I/II/III large subunit